MKDPVFYVDIIFLPIIIIFLGIVFIAHIFDIPCLSWLFRPIGGY